MKPSFALCALGALAALFASGCTTSPNQGGSKGPLGLSASMLTTPYSLVHGVNPLVLGVAAAAAYNAYLPTWSQDDIPIGQNRYRISLRKKTFSSGGDGEAMQVFKHRADQIAAQHGYERFEILEFTEGMDSSGPLGSQRVAQGVIVCQGKRATEPAKPSHGMAGRVQGGSAAAVPQPITLPDAMQISPLQTQTARP